MATIKIYTTPSCVYCKMAKEYFQKNSLSYQEFNVAEDERARDEMIQKSGQLGVPVVDIDGQIFIGFDRKAFDKIFAKK